MKRIFIVTTILAALLPAAAFAQTLSSGGATPGRARLDTFCVSLGYNF